jgi:hypothetical protein
MPRRKKRQRTWEEVSSPVLEFLRTRPEGAEISELETWASSVDIPTEDLHQGLSWLLNEGKVYSPAKTSTRWCTAATT